MGITGSTLHDSKFFGLRIYKIFKGGPLAESGLTELDNFIIPPDDVLFQKISFHEYIKSNINKIISLQIYSVIKRFFYTIEVIPRNDLGDPKNGFLGACVRYENWSTAHTNLLRVIKVKENSISESILKLNPLDDYIISIRPEDKDFITLNKDKSDPMTVFQEVLQDNIANFIEVFIYNVKTGPRSIRLFLEQKNGEILGCDVAYGRLHELPRIYNEVTDKNLVYKNTEENGLDSKNDSTNDNKKEDFVLEETKKILLGNINRNKVSNDNLKKEENNESSKISKNNENLSNYEIIKKTNFEEERIDDQNNENLNKDEKYKECILKENENEIKDEKDYSNKNIEDKNMENIDKDKILEKNVISLSKEICEDNLNKNKKDYDDIEISNC